MAVRERNAKMDFLKLSVLTFVICSVSSSPVQVNDSTNGISEFARNFYSQCVEAKSGNVIVSPLSVANALALLSQGSNGKTFEELKKGLHLSDDKIISANQFLEHRETLQKNVGKSTLSIANRIYIQQGQQLNKNFQEVAISKFMSSVEPLNFVESEKSAKIINNFVEEATNGKIQDLIKSDQLNDATRSVLVNAIYFRGTWEKPFLKENTFKKDFYISETEKQSVDFMFNSGLFKYAYLRDLKMSALEMKYANSNISFVIVLPKQRMGLTALESQLKTYDWAKITDEMYMEEVDVHMPKFKVEYELKLNDVLKNMGMSEMFTENANLNGILETSEPLRVSDVVHKAFIEINEEGTEASAATDAEVQMMMMPPQFRVDHPFMYFIRDTETNTVIFSGRIVKF